MTSFYDGPLRGQQMPHRASKDFQWLSCAHTSIHAVRQGGDLVTAQQHNRKLRADRPQVPYQVRAGVFAFPLIQHYGSSRMHDEQERDRLRWAIEAHNIKASGLERSKYRIAARRLIGYIENRVVPHGIFAFVFKEPREL
jgi:hypothetical protein